MFNIKKVKRLEAKIKELQETTTSQNKSIKNAYDRIFAQVDIIKELQSKIDRLGLYRDSKGRSQSTDTQL